jgi:hypothetical protein
MADSDKKLIRYGSRVEALNLISSLTGVDDYETTTDMALGILLWSLREIQRGRVIASLDVEKAEYAELNMDLFKRARERAGLEAGDDRGDLEPPQDSEGGSDSKI